MIFLLFNFSGFLLSNILNRPIVAIKGMRSSIITCIEDTALNLS